MEKGIEFHLIGALYSIRFIIRALLEIPSGLIADALGRRGVMLFSYAMYLFSFPAYYLSTSFAWLIIPTVLFGIGDAFRTGTHKAMIFEYLKRNNWSTEKTDYYGHTRSWSQFGSAISSLCAGIIVLVTKNYSSIFLYTIIPYLIGFILLASYPKYLNGNSSAGTQKALQKLFQTLKLGYHSIGKMNSIRAFTSVSLFSGFYFSVKDYIQPLIQSLALTLPFFIARSEKDRSTLLIAVIYFILYFLTTIAAKKAGRIQKRFGSGPRTLNSLLLIGLLCGIAAGAGTVLGYTLLAIGMFVIILIIENIRRPVGVAYLAEEFDEDVLATVLSIESQLSSVFAAILSLCLGYLIEFSSLGYSLTIISFICVLFGYGLKLKQHDHIRREIN